MKKILLTAFIILLVFLQANILLQANALFCSAQDSIQKIRVVHNFTRIFSHKNNLETLSQQQLDEVTIKLAFLGDIFDVVNEEGEFFCISFLFEQDLVEGYVFKAAVIDNNIQSPQVFLQTNATIIQSCCVFKFENNKFEMLENIFLEKGTQVRLQEKLTAKNDYTLISFDYNQQILNFYVESKNLKQNKLDRSILTAITLMFVSLSAGGVLLKIFKRNKIKKAKT